MNKKEADIILLACKKYGISLTMRKEGEVYFVSFGGRLECLNFDAAKSITNGLVLESRARNEKKGTLKSAVSPKAISYSKYPKSKKRPDGGVGFAERHGLANR